MITMLILPMALYHYEMWCYDLGWIVIGEHVKSLEAYWDGL